MSEAAVMAKPIRSWEEILEEGIDRSAGPDGCWPWTGYVNGAGYGEVSRSRLERGYTHREAYRLAHGEIAADLTVDHTCHRADECDGGSSCPHRRCGNPRHLEAVPAEINKARGSSPLARKARQTECIHGHPLSGNNLRVRPNGRRQCLTCRTKNSRVAYLRRRDRDRTTV